MTVVAMRLLAGLLVSCAIALPALADDPEARAWLERMTQTLANRNYDGKFFHLRNARSETLRIIHRVDGGKVSERLVAMDGSGREIIRTDNEVVCYLPDRRLVLVERRSGDTPLVAALPSYTVEIDAHYAITRGQTAKVLGRKTQMISVQPRDEYRYGYRLWLDYETAMPLKSQLCDREGQVIEEILFAQLELPDTIPAAALKPEVPADGFRWFRQAVQPAVPSSRPGWRVLNLPDGFRLTTTRVQAVNGSGAAVQHLVFSDGLASVSVFIEPTSRTAVPLQGLSKMGSAYAFSTEVEGHQVTAVGEVPAATVRVIASSVEVSADQPER